MGKVTQTDLSENAAAGFGKRLSRRQEKRLSKTLPLDFIEKRKTFLRTGRRDFGDLRDCRMRSFCLIVILFFLTAPLPAGAQEFVPLWEAGKMPNSKGIVLKDEIRD